MGHAFGFVVIPECSTPIFQQIERDVLPVRVHYAGVRSAEFKFVVRVYGEQADRTVPATRAWIQGEIEFGKRDSARKRLAYELEVELGDSGPFSVRVPSRFVEADARSVLRASVIEVPEDQEVGQVGRRDAGETEGFYSDGSTWLRTRIVPGQDQTMVMLNAADRAIMTSAFHEALRVAQRNAPHFGIQPEPILEDTAAFVDGLPRSRPKPPPDNGVTGGFSLM